MYLKAGTQSKFAGHMILFIHNFMNEVNNFASVNFGHYGKSKHFALDLGISFGAAPLRILLISKVKCLNFSQCPQVTYVQLLTIKQQISV